MIPLFTKNYRYKQKSFIRRKIFRAGRKNFSLVTEKVSARDGKKCNFGFAELTLQSELKRKIKFSFVLHSFFCNFAREKKFTPKIWKQNSLPQSV